MAKRKKTKSEQYLTNAELMPELMRAKRLNRITPELGKMFILIVDRYSTHPWFVGYSPGWIEEMRQDALVALVRGSLKFDPTFAERQGKNPNGFSYLTTITYRSFKSTRDKLKRQTDIQENCPVGLF